MKRNLCLLLLAILAPALAQADVLFRDDFTGGKSPEWIQINDGSESGSFHAEGGSYRLVSRDSLSSLPRAIVRSAAQRNYFIQADVRIIPIAHDVAAASLISYYNDSRHFYEFDLDALNRFWFLRKVDKSGSALLAQGLVFGPARSLYRLGLYVSDSDIRVFIDGVMVAQQQDSRSLSGGGFGLAAQGAEARWDNVLVRNSNPQDFFYAITSGTTDGAGRVAFSTTHLVTTDQNNKPLAGITVYRIRRDGLSYFVIQDPRRNFAARSGFLTEFTTRESGEYIVRLRNIGAPVVVPRSLPTYQVDWLSQFVQRSARFAPDQVTADLSSLRDVHLRQGSFFQQGGDRITDSTVASAGEAAEINGIIFGDWDNFGNFLRFPSVSGRASGGDALTGQAASAFRVPQNSKFTMHKLTLSAGGPPVSIVFYFQEDSRAFILVDSASLPAKLERGKSYNVPFSILNTGENAGPFEISIVLSLNSFPGASDLRLARRSFSGLGAGQVINSELSIQTPGNLKDGLYFIATFLESPAGNARDKLLRVHNGNFVEPTVLGSFPASGRMDITLSWSGAADLDLHVTDPYAETIYYFHPTSESGGSLQQDGECAGSGDHQETVSYPSGMAASGMYQISIHYFRACGSANDVTWNVKVDSDKGTQNYSGNIHPGDYLRAADYQR